MKTTDRTKIVVGALVKYSDGEARVVRVGFVGAVEAVWLDGVDGYHQPKHLEVITGAGYYVERSQ